MFCLLDECHALKDQGRPVDITWSSLQLFYWHGIDYRDLVFSCWCCWKLIYPGIWCSDIGSYTSSDTVWCGKKNWV